VLVVELVVSVLASIALLWLVLLVVVAVSRPDAGTLAETARIVPDTARLVHRLARDPELGGGVRLRLWLLLAYLASPIDLIPDFIPVIGYADDAAITGLVLRSVIRSAGANQVREQWPGSDDGLAALARLCRLSELTPRGAEQARAALVPERRARLLRRGFVLEGVTLGWNVVGVVVLAVAALRARSVALGGFGLDSLIEIGASTVVIWELSGSDESRQRTALRLIGVAFLVLAVYLAVQSAWVLVNRHEAHTSPLGIAWTGLTALVMFGLAAGKARTGRELDNPVLQTEGKVTLVDALLATAVLAGLTLDALAGWWWADPVAALVIVVYGGKEGLAAFRTGR
jgi:uncharacterized membrane protein YkvA (DUF1232 family)